MNHYDEPLWWLMLMVYFDAWLWLMIIMVDYDGLSRLLIWDACFWWLIVLKNDWTPSIIMVDCLQWRVWLIMMIHCDGWCYSWLWWWILIVECLMFNMITNYHGWLWWLPMVVYIRGTWLRADTGLEWQLSVMLCFHIIICFHQSSIGYYQLSLHKLVSTIIN